uniref:Uncharacterized protein n=1 Tax=Siphoviridae sp. ctFRY1 TaxID=2827820 RepID=A0A8S5SU09_9CAUD|nr:MAG TPA: hypothetical protein [Siphoviridae sp. ctFRY1]
MSPLRLRLHKISGCIINGSIVKIAAGVDLGNQCMMDNGE